MVDDSPTLEVPLDTLVGEEKTVENIEMKKEKPKYPCIHCDNTFSSKNSRRRHLKRMHGNKNRQNEGPRESHQTQQAEPTSRDAEAEIVKENLRRVEKGAEMSCLSRPCPSTSRTVDISTAELKMEDLTVLDIIQLQDFCVKWSLVSSGNRATLIDRSSGVNKKPKKFKTVWHGFQGILKLSGRVNQASLKLSAGFSNKLCLISLTFFFLL